MTQVNPHRILEGVEQPQPSRLTAIPATSQLHRSNSARSAGASSTGSRKRKPHHPGYKMPAPSNGAGGGGGGETMATKPTFLVVNASGGDMRFLIMDSPKQNNLHLYIKEMRNHSVTSIVRACERYYDSTQLETAGIEVHNMEYADGHSPPPEIIQRWLELVDNTFFGANSAASSSSAAPCIAIHCVAGLGRAPQLVALAMIEFANMDAVDAVTMIRKHRKGTINGTQLQYLNNYKKSYKRASGGGAGGDSGCCVIQ